MIVPAMLKFLWCQVLFPALSYKKNGAPDSSTSMAKQMGHFYEQK